MNMNTTNMTDSVIVDDDKKITSNIVSNEVYKKMASKTLTKISDSIKNSLGYYGSSTIIEDRINGHVITKDGYTILKSMKFENPISTTIFEIIKKVSYNLVQTVGDGSTSSIVIAEALFNFIQNAMNKKDDPNNLTSVFDISLKKYSSKEIFDCLKEIEKELITEINKVATPITDKNFEKLKNIAEVSNNNDTKTGTNIYDIYSKIKDEGFIYLENSSDTEDSYEMVNGIEFMGGMISEDFSTDKNRVECKFKDCHIFMCNDRLDSTDLNYMVDVVGTLVAQHTKPVVIIAKSFSVEFVSCWLINKRQNPDLKICLIDFPFANKNQEEIFKDIAIYTGATIFDKNSFGEDDYKNNFYKMLGSCDEIVINNRTTKIIGRHGFENNINDRIEFIEEQINNLKQYKSDDYEFKIFQLEKRKANLKSLIVKYYVGGDTELEKNTRKYLIEDSIYACKAALETGYVSGGNLTIPKIIQNKIFGDLIIENNLKNNLYMLIKSSFVECYTSVLKNKFSNNDSIINDIISECLKNNEIYNLKTDKYEFDNETGIINSAKTEIEILKATFSIVGLLVTSNQYIGKSF